jgi:flagellar hook-associated protein 1 FlgK
MSNGLLNVGVRALMANQTVLQTTGNNIANVNTPGYSRQVAVLQTVTGQYTGAGYIGKGVEISTIERTYSDFLTRQSALAGATSSGDTARAEKLKQLETLFQGGADGLGAAVSDMLNAFSDVATSPTDLTARTVALTRVSETAQRISGTAASMDDLQQNLTLELKNKVTAINSLASGIASVNEKIARAQGIGQPPNDLLDQRDQLVRELNQYIQTTSIPATDGTMGIFIGGSQALVLGNSAASLSLTTDDFGVPNSNLALIRDGASITLNENTLGGGEVPGLLRFQKTDMAEARNLLGRYSLAVTTSMNDQHQLGLDLDGNVGGNLFTPIDLNTGNNVLSPKAPATLNSATVGNLTLDVADVTRLVASDYEVNFSGAAAGTVTRLSDGMSTAFTFVAGAGGFTFTNQNTGQPENSIDGLALGSALTSAPVAGDRFLLKPFSTSASNVTAEFSSPRALAVASPWAGAMGTSNTGSLQLAGLKTLTNPFDPSTPTANASLTLKFVDANHFIRSDDANYPNTATAQNYYFDSTTPIQAAIPNNMGTANPPSIPYTYALSDWSVSVQGAAKAGDTFTVKTMPTVVRNLNSGNASAMMNLRDVATFDGASLTDGYAGLIAQIGIRSQSASYTAGVSSAIAASLEKDRTAVSGVNLDEEAAKLLQYQQAYQASAKVIQIAQGIFDTLIQTMSR